MEKATENLSSETCKKRYLYMDKIDTDKTTSVLNMEIDALRIAIPFYFSGMLWSHFILFVVP
jgi:hypothetical protein